MSLNNSVLFDPQTEPVRFDLPGADVTLFPSFFGAEESEALLRELLNNTHWRQDFITIYGRRVRLPRLTAWYGDAGRPYTYSGITMRPEQWTPTLLAVKERIEPVSGVTFTSVLLNLYRDGSGRRFVAPGRRAGIRRGAGDRLGQPRPDAPLSDEA